jgi:hypothetical protein
LLQPIFPVLVLASVQITLELKAFKGIWVRLARWHSEGISKQYSLLLFMKLKNARGHTKLICNFLSRKLSLEWEELWYISWFIRLWISSPIQTSEDQSVERKGGYSFEAFEPISANSFLCHFMERETGHMISADCHWPKGSWITFWMNHTQISCVISTGNLELKLCSECKLSEIIINECIKCLCVHL